MAGAFTKPWVLTLLVALAFLCLPGIARAATPALLGIGEQESATLDDPLFASLGITRQRLTLPWDSTDGSWPLYDTDRWLSESQRLGMEPLVVFGQSRLSSRKRVLPSVSAYVKRFRAFRSRYPWVLNFGAWNEANYKGQPTYKNPKRVGQYYLALRRECPSCTIMAGSFLDTSNLIPYVRSFQRVVGKGPHIWGFHNYTDLSLYRDKTTRRFIRAVKGPVWLVEVGGLAVYRPRKGGNLNRRPASEPSQKKVVRYLTGPMLSRNPRIRRVYIYQWRTDPGASWDSGLVRPDGTPRPALSVLRKALQQGRLISR